MLTYSNKHLSKRRKGTQGGSGKIPVIGLIQRRRTVPAHVVKSASSKEVLPMMLKNVKCNAIVITDESMIYREVNQILEHYVINHSFDNSEANSGFGDLVIMLICNNKFSVFCVFI